MDRRVIAFTLALIAAMAAPLCASSGWARGLGVLGMCGRAAGGACSTTSFPVDQTGDLINSYAIGDTLVSGVTGTVLGAGKSLKAVQLRTAEGGTAGATVIVYISTSLDFSGTILASSTTTAPTPNEVFTVDFPDRPVLADGTTYYIGVFSSDATWTTRFLLTLVLLGDGYDSLYWYTNDGLDGPFTGPNAGGGLWIRVEVCE